MLTFTRNEQNKLVLDMNVFPRTQGDFTTHSKYNLGANPQNLPQMLEELLALQNPVSGGVLSKQEAEHVSLFAMRSVEGIVPSGGMDEKSKTTKTTKTDETRRLGELVEGFNGKVEGEPKKEQLNDGWDLVTSFLDTYKSRSDPEGVKKPFTTHAYFTFALLNEELAFVEKNLDNLSPSERLSALQELSKRIGSFEKAMKGDLLFNLYGHDDPLKAFKGRLEAMQKVIVAEGLKSQDVMQQNLRGNIHVDRTQAVAASVPVAALKVEAAAPAKAEAPGPLQIHHAKLNELRTAFESKQIDTALELFTELSKAVDGMLDKKEYKDAIDLATAIQSLLPPPAAAKTDHNNFWKQFTTEKEDIDKLSKFGTAISEISKFHWEAFTHLHRRHMQPDELVNGINTRAILVKVARMKSMAAKEKALKNYEIFSQRYPENTSKNDSLLSALVSISSVSPKIDMLAKYGIWGSQSILFKQGMTPLTQEEVASMAYDSFQTDLPQFIEILDHHPFYRFSDDPQLDAKMVEVRNFLTTVSEDGGKVYKDADVVRLDAQVDVPDNYSKDSLYVSSLVLIDNFYKPRDKDGKPPASNFEQYQKIWAQTGKGAIPQEMQQIRFHTAMFQTMYRPEYSQALSFEATAMGNVKAVNWVQGIHRQAMAIASDLDEVPQTMADLA